MKRTFVAAGVVVLALSELARAAADEAKFYPPPGWAVAKQPDGNVVVQPPGVPAGKTCALLIMPDVPQGEVNVVHAMGWKLMIEPVKVVSGGEVRAARTMAGFDMRSTTAVVDPPNAARAYMHSFSVQVGAKVRRALYVSDDKASFDKYLPTVKAMLDEVGVDPAVAKQKREASKGQPTGFGGVFYRGSVDFNPAGGRGEREIRVDFLCLMPDGRAYNGRPAGGPAACFERDADDLRSSSYGVYTLNGDDVVIKWNFDRTLNQQHTQKLKRRGDGKLEADGGGGIFHKFGPCDGLKLDGTYAITWGDDTKTRIRFTKDGRFSEQGLKTCANLEDFQNPDLPKLPEHGGAGTYSIASNTLEVKYDNGGSSRRMFFFTPDDPADPARVSRISIAVYPLVKEQ
jgi:hypothetical protein